MVRTLAPLYLPLALVASLPSHASLCTPEDEASRALDELQELREECGRTAECWDRQRAALESALASHPADIHLHRAYQDLYRRFAPSDREIDLAALEARYLGWAEEHPHDPGYLYLYGRWVTDPAVALDYFERSVEAGPDFAWGHLGLIHEYAYEKEHKDLGKAEKHIDRFLELCPSQVGTVLAYRRLVDDDDYWRERLPRLRAALDGADPAEIYRYYRMLWTLEFKLMAPNEHAGLRGRVAADLERLAALELWDERSWTASLKTGYDLIGDADKSAWVEDEALRRRPCDSVLVAFERWGKEHPAPGESASAEEHAAWNRRRYETTRDWSERCPDDFNTAQIHFRAVTSLDPVPEEELVAAGERVTAAWDKIKGGPGGIFPSPYHQVAEGFLKHGLAERAPALIDEAVAEMEAKLEALRASSASEVELAERGRFPLRALWDSRRLLAETRLALGEVDAAHQLLLELAEELERFRPAEGASSDDARDYEYHAGQYWRVAALVAEHQGRKLDAMAFHLKTNSIGTWRPGDDPLGRARELWRELGGTDAGWQSFSLGDLEAPTASLWKDLGEPLAAFALTDLEGRTWSLDELKGKKVFANLWATWCGPCRQELPFVQDLYRRLADDDNVVVVTLNLDDNPGLVAPYMKKSEFSFPVLFASDWVEDNDIARAIPRNWILDGEGNLVKEQVGFNPEVSAEDWVGDVLEQLEGLAAAGGS